MFKNQPYVHTEDLHNLESPRQIVPVIMEWLKPQSVVDVGCGIGTFLFCFKQAGVKQVLGIDGHWANRALMKKYLDDTEFTVANLNEPITVNRKFDLAVCLEVAEHLKESEADTVVKSLTGLSNIILFSAAVPGQGGENHINEQWIQYWQAKFAKEGYIVHDVLRKVFWNNEKVFWWYKQNMFIVAHKNFTPDFSALKKYETKEILNYIHPDTHLYKSHLLQNVILRGRYGFANYTRLFFKGLLRTFKIRK